jgi:hypothetical protein
VNILVFEALLQAGLGCSKKCLVNMETTGVLVGILTLKYAK